jgi:hypothetical protein
MRGPSVEDAGRKGAEESNERIHRREKTGWKAQRKMDTRMLRVCYKCKKWRSWEEDRDAWRWRTEEAKAHVEL